jgi:hypothetical protein
MTMGSGLAPAIASVMLRWELGAFNKSLGSCGTGDTYSSRNEPCSFAVNEFQPKIRFGPVTVTVRAKTQSRPAPAQDMQPSSLSCRAHLRFRAWHASQRAPAWNCTKSPWTMTSPPLIMGGGRAAMILSPDGLGASSVPADFVAETPRLPQG